MENGVRFVDEDGLEIRIDAGRILHLPIVCCDCGLAHDIKVEVDKGDIIVRVTAAEDLTDLARSLSDVVPSPGACHDALKELLPDIDERQEAKP